jgi:hypothetical protein
MCDIPEHGHGIYILTKSGAVVEAEPGGQFHQAALLKLRRVTKTEQR